jgi:hypothetical protein
VLAPQALEVIGAPGVPQLLDLPRQRRANAFQLAQASLLDQRRELGTHRSDDDGRALVRLAAEARRPGEGEHPRDLVERARYLVVVLHRQR